MKISEQTSVTLSLVVTIIGGVIWLSVMYQKVEAHQEKLQTIESQQNGFERGAIDRLARIEEKLDYFLKLKK